MIDIQTSTAFVADYNGSQVSGRVRVCGAVERLNYAADASSGDNARTASAVVGLVANHLISITATIDGAALPSDEAERHAWANCLPESILAAVTRAALGVEDEDPAVGNVEAA